MFVTVTGGSGSGKSAFAEEQILKFPEKNRLYIATMDFSIEPRSREQRLQRRIIRHLTHVLIPIFHSMTEPVMTV